MLKLPVIIGMGLIGLGTALIGRTLKNGTETAKHNSGRRNGDHPHQSHTGNQPVHGAGGVAPQLDKRKRKNARMEPDTLVDDHGNGSGDGGGGQHDAPPVNRPLEGVSKNEPVHAEKRSRRKKTPEEKEQGGANGKRTAEKGVSPDPERREKSPLKLDKKDK